VRILRNGTSEIFASEEHAAVQSIDLVHVPGMRIKCSTLSSAGSCQDCFAARMIHAVGIVEHKELLHIEVSCSVLVGANNGLLQREMEDDVTLLGTWIGWPCAFELESVANDAIAVGRAERL
jgi:hypothetical protein